MSRRPALVDASLWVARRGLCRSVCLCGGRRIPTGGSVCGSLVIVAAKLAGSDGGRKLAGYGGAQLWLLLRRMCREQKMAHTHHVNRFFVYLSDLRGGQIGGVRGWLEFGGVRGRTVVVAVALIVPGTKDGT